MTKSNPVPAGSLSALLRKQADLITRSQALAVGITESALRNKLRPNGPWRIVLPGIYLARNGLLTIGQREIAAVMYAGRGCVITGPAALRRRGVPVPIDDVVDVLIPESSKRRSIGFVRIHRTTRMPSRPWKIDGIPYCDAARAATDAVWGDSDRGRVTSLVAAVVQNGACTVEQLVAELRAGPKPGFGVLRAVLAEVAAGIASAAEADFAELIRRHGLPEPMYNPRLFAGTEFLAKADAWWGDAGVAAEVDSREWHLSPASWERTMARHARMSARGIIVFHYPPSRIRSDSAGIASELRSALAAGRQRPRLPIQAVPTGRSLAAMPGGSGPA